MLPKLKELKKELKFASEYKHTFDEFFKKDTHLKTDYKIFLKKCNKNIILVTNI